MATVPPDLFKLIPNDQTSNSFSFHSLSTPSTKVAKARKNSNRRRTLVSCKKSKNEEAWEEKKVGSVDYDKGKYRVSVQVTGLRKDDIPKRYRLRVEGDSWQRDWTISGVVQRILKLNHWDDIEGVLNRWAGRFARKNFPVLIREITKSGSLEHSVQVFRWMKIQKNYCARNDIYNMLIRLHARHNRIDQARGLFFEMQKWSFPIQTVGKQSLNGQLFYHAAISVGGLGLVGKLSMLSSSNLWTYLGKVHSVWDCEEVARHHGYCLDRLPNSISGITRFPSSQCSNCPVSTSSVHVRGARESYYCCNDCPHCSCRCKPDAETYDALINVHGRAGQWRWATNIMDDMLCAAIPPSRLTYNNLINACASSGNWREALKVCKKMTENGVGPDLVTHNIVLSAYKNGAQYGKALSYFELMKGTNIRPDSITLNIIIHCLVKLGQYGKAVDIFNSMREKRSECRPDVVTFTSIIHAYSVYGQIENCKAVFDMMLAEGLKPNIVSYNALIGAYALRGMHNDALIIFNELKRSGFRPDVVSYTSLLNAYGRSGQPEKAREIFDMMKRNSWKPNIVSYNALIDAYGSEGFLAEAVEVLREMERNGVQPNVVTICTILAACGRCGQTVKIDSVLSAAEMRGIELNTVAYNSAIGSYMNVGEYEKALTLYRSMRGKKAAPDSATFNVLISGSCKMAKYGEALKFVDEMMNLKIPMSKEVYSSVICAYSKQGQLEEAESMFTMMKVAGCLPDVLTYTTMIHAYSAAENWQKAHAFFQEMEMNDITPDSIACSSLMRAFNRGGQPAQVLLLAEMMKVKRISFNEATFFEMISACSMLRDWKTTINLIELVEPSISRVSVGLLNQLLHFLGKSGKVETMMKFFYKILESDADINFETYSILLRNLSAAGKWRKYIEVLQWMEDTGIQPSVRMYRNVSSFAWKGGGTEFTSLFQKRIELLERNGAGMDTGFPSTSRHPTSPLIDRRVEQSKLENYNLLD